MEIELLEKERSAIQHLSSSAPKDSEAFLAWFESLSVTGPGQNSKLFDFLEHNANFEQMKWFIQQEVAGEAGFDDLTALAQIKMPVQAKLEMARNYWDEMGHGKQEGMHGLMLKNIAEEFSIAELSTKETIAETLALSNVMIAMAMNRNYAYHAIGALGVIELTAPARAKKVAAGLKRLGVSRHGQQYYLLHSVLDLKHSADWNREVLLPLVKEDASVAASLAEGALMRLNAGARCYQHYEHYLMTPVFDL